MIVFQESAKTLSALQGSDLLSDFHPRLQDPMLQALMITLTMEMNQVIRGGLAQRLYAEPICRWRPTAILRSSTFRLVHCGRSVCSLNPLNPSNRARTTGTFTVLMAPEAHSRPRCPSSLGDLPGHDGSSGLDFCCRETASDLPSGLPGEAPISPGN